MARLHIVLVKYPQYVVILATKKRIIEKKHLLRNMMKYYVNTVIKKHGIGHPPLADASYIAIIPYRG